MDPTTTSNVERLVVPKSGKSDINLVFVHGISNDWHFTWDKDKSLSWLQDLLPNDLPKASIYVYGFDLLKRLSGEKKSLKKEIKPLVDFMMLKDQLPCIFIAHSLGGIILREAIMLIGAENAQKLVQGIVFLAAPTLHGLQVEDWEGFAARLRAATMESEDQSRVEWSQLGNVNERFKEFAESLLTGRVLCVYEALPIYRIGIILPQKFAVFEDVEMAVSSADHLAIGKFDTIFDTRYQFLVRSIRSVGRGDVGVKQEIAEILTYTSEATISADGREAVLDAPEIFDRAKNLAWYALALEDYGQYREAEVFYRKALDEYESILTKNGHQDISHAEDFDRQRFAFYFFCLDKLASVLRDQSKFTEAEKTADEVWKLRKGKLGVADVTTLSSAGNLARILRYQGKNKKAYGIVRDALIAIEESPFGSIAGTTAVSILAKILKELGIYQISELLSRDVIRACSQLLGPDHPFTLNRESDLAVLKSKQGEFAAAERIARHAFDGLYKVLGPSHPNTLRTNKRLASYLRFQGKFNELLPELEQIRDDQIKHFGLSHPETLSTLCGIASVYALQGDFREAKKLLQSVVDERLKIFPMGHIDTEWARKGIAKLELAESTWISPRDLQQNLASLALRRKKKRGTKRKYSSATKEDSTSSRIDEIVTFFSSPTRPQDFHLEGKENLFDNLHRYSNHSVADAILSTGPDDWRRKFTTKELGEALRVACVRGDGVMVSRLLNEKVDPRAIGGYYGNALQAAAYAGSTQIVELLLSNYEIDTNAWVGIFGSALRAASLQGNEAVVKVLIHHGAKPDVRDDHLGSALQAALIRKQLRLAELLLENDADPDAVDISFGSPLQEASCSGNEDLVKLLLQYRANPNLRKGVIGSPLLMAASENHPEIVKQLLKENPSDEPDMRLEGFEAALQIASFSGFMDVVQSLVEHVHLDTKESGTALQAAHAGGHLNVVKEILNQVASDGAESSSASLNEG